MNMDPDLTDLTADDLTRIGDALQYYLDRISWPEGDAERAEYERLANMFPETSGT